MSNLRLEIIESGRRESSAEKCRRNGWVPGTRLVGDEGYGPTVIEITAIGESDILAKTISHNGIVSGCHDEGVWTLDCRDWKKVGERALTLPSD